MKSLEEVMKKLNVKQLNEFQKIFFSQFEKEPNANYLLTAPTGVGKTLLSELLMLSNEGKSVYISPLRALSMQIYDEVSIHRPSVLMTGDVYAEEPKEVEGDIIVTTYEKFDSVIRRNYEWVDDVNLVILDEIHNMKDPIRGQSIESLLSWAREEGKQIVTMSATVGNIDEIGNWLDAKIIRYDVRPIPLKEYVKFGNKMYDSSNKQYELKNDIIYFVVKKGKNILIFENTRKRAESLYNQLKETYGDLVTLFHGGLDFQERQRILKEIMEGKKRVIVSTTALGQGVNLPIYCVYFRSMTLPVIENGRFEGWRPLTAQEYKQISGRAGRPRFDTEGMSIIEAKTYAEITYFINNYLKGRVENVKSQLSLPDFILSVIVRKTYTDLEGIKKSLSYTMSLKNAKDEAIKRDLDILSNHDLIHYDGMGYSSTPLGRAISYAYISVDDALYFLNVIEDEKIDIKYIIANSPKVMQISKNADTYDILEEWVLGAELKELTQYGNNMTEKDIRQIIDAMTWQAFAFWRVLEAVEHKERTRALKVWQSVLYGVPADAVNLVKLRGIGRKTALELYELGYTTKKEICEDIANVKKELQPNTAWRIDQLCNSKNKDDE